MPVHGLIHARDDNIIPSRHGMAAETEGRTSNKNQAIPEASKATKAPCGNQDPPARIPEITWRKPVVTSKQITTTPRRNESGEKKSETDSETELM